MHDEMMGIEITRLPSLAGTDKWHSDHNYLSKPKMTGTLFNKFEGKAAVYNIYLENFKRRILAGEDFGPSDTLKAEVKEGVDYKNIPDKKSEQDSLLRTEWQDKENYNLVYYPSKKDYNGISRFVFFTPINGSVINGFNIKTKHYGVDILSKKDTPIKATLDGTVLLSTWTFEGGYVIIIQHEEDITSVYKHNSTLLKLQGERVKAGEPIAIIGNTGKLSTGPHLHFELWYQRNPVNPADFINFD